MDSAIARGSRTPSGVPGPNYWQQTVRYVIDAELDPAHARLTGREHVTYRNHSPDTLHEIRVHLYQNVNRADAIRTESVPITPGVELSLVSVDGQHLIEHASVVPGAYVVAGTVATLGLPRPLAPHDSSQIDVEWSLIVPGPGDPHMGQDGEVFFLGYWYPQIAVYDDVNGWQSDPFLVKGEFYMDYADYDVRFRVPGGWLVGSSGELSNPEEVLSADAIRRLRAAGSSDSVVHVSGAASRGTAPGEGVREWRFHAERVRDFAIGASDRVVWDAVRLTSPNGGQPIMIHALYRPDRVPWQSAAVGARAALEFMQYRVVPYPYKTLTVVEGLLGGGMEFPAITLIGSSRDTVALLRTEAHEIAHMWFPMLVGSDEKRFAWQDEGFATFLTAEFWKERFGNDSLQRLSRAVYLGFARRGSEVEMMRPHDQFPVNSTASVAASYHKSATALYALRWIIGAAAFDAGIRRYATAWSFKHPKPHDFWAMMASAAGRNLDWFWRSWYYDTWTLDHAVASVREKSGTARITIADRGSLPMPADVLVCRVDGTREHYHISVDKWLHGATRATINISAKPSLVGVTVDPEDDGLPDIDRTNQSWHRDESVASQACR